MLIGGSLNAPWGILEKSGLLYVGNFGGEGRINIYRLDRCDQTKVTYIGQLKDNCGNEIGIDGLWGLYPSYTGNSLIFAAGIDDEAYGLVGYLKF